MAKNNKTQENVFKIGDFVIGKNQSFKRTIYEVAQTRLRKSKTWILLVPREFDGQHFSLRESEIWVLWRKANLFRLATETDFAKRNFNPGRSKYSEVFTHANGDQYKIYEDEQ